MLVVLALIVFHSYTMQSGSNVPTLYSGDVILGSEAPYGLSRYSVPTMDFGVSGRIFGHEPRRGDMAIFALPRDTSIVYVKRVIGLPGDRVQMKEGRLYLNRTIVRRDPVPAVEVEGMYSNARIPAAAYRETLPNGISYRVVKIMGDVGFNDNTEEVTVPAGRYFVLGDNRDNSIDSRVAPDLGGVGLVPLDNFIAQAEYVLSNKQHPERALTAIR